MKLEFGIVEGSFSIHQLPPGSEIPENIYRCSFYCITRTGEELSIVCPSSIPLISEKSSAGWSCIKVMGILDFSLTGILSDISSLLAKADISIFAISTYNTDYILVKSDQLEKARKALRKEGYSFLN